MTVPNPDAPEPVDYGTVCRHCAAGRSPSWQAHSREWVHVSSVVAGRGSQWSITVCGANRERQRRMARDAEAAKL